MIYSSTSPHPLPYIKNNLGHHAPNPNHVPDTDDNAFMQQKLTAYELFVRVVKPAYCSVYTRGIVKGFAGVNGRVGG